MELRDPKSRFLANSVKVQISLSSWARLREFQSVIWTSTEFAQNRDLGTPVPLHHHGVIGFWRKFHYMPKNLSQTTWLVLIVT